MNEWVMVRREERAIYTYRQNLTIQICVGSSDTDRQNFRRLIKTLFIRADNWASSPLVGTHGGCRDFWLLSGHPMASRAWRLSLERWDFRRESGLPTVGTPGKHQKFRWPKSQKLYLSVREVLKCLSIVFILMLEHYIFLRPHKLASLFIVRHT